MTDDTDDQTVDVLCLGGGGGLIAAAVLAADAGHDVVLARCALVFADSDPASSPLTALVEGLRVETAGSESAVPLFAEATPSTVAEPSAPTPPPRRPRQVSLAPFVGRRLQRWAQQCLDAGHGVVADRTSGRPPADAPVDADGPVEHAVLGTVTFGSATSVPATSGPVTPEPASPGDTVRAWLADRLAAAEVEVRSSVTLSAWEVDEETGAPVGARLTDTDGRTVTVRARHGVVFGFGTADPPWDVVAPDGPSRIALVGRPASRFARLALLPG